MIVNQVQTGWEVIYHRAHALLAAQIAGHWAKNNAPIRLYETIAAISHHDDLEKEWESDSLTEAGAPQDFTIAPADEEKTLRMWRQHLENARYRGRWVALLTSKHFCFLSQDKWDSPGEWQNMLKEQVELQQKWVHELGIEKEEAEKAYQFMGWCDRLSLILAQGKIPDAGRALEITSGVEGVRYDVRELEDGKLTVEPWCFDKDNFTVNVESTILSQLQFASNEELVARLKEGEMKVKEWTFVKT